MGRHQTGLHSFPNPIGRFERILLPLEKKSNFANWINWNCRRNKNSKLTWPEQYTLQNTGLWQQMTKERKKAEKNTTTYHRRYAPVIKSFKYLYTLPLLYILSAAAACPLDSTCLWVHKHTNRTRVHCTRVRQCDCYTMWPLKYFMSSKMTAVVGNGPALQRTCVIWILS